MVSYFTNIARVVRNKTYEPEYILDKLANPSGKQRDVVDKVRGTEDEQERKKLKKKIPVITWNGEFTRRCNAGFIRPSGYMYVDIDQHVRPSQLLKIPHLSAAWKSVSGKGYGALMRINNLDSDNFRSTFAQVDKTFHEHGIKIDRLTDIARANFISYDENTIFRSVEPMLAIEPDYDVSYNVGKVITEMHNHTVCSVCLAYTKKKYSFVNGEKDNFTFLYFIQCNSFGIDLDYAYWFADENFCTSAYTWNKAVSIYRRYQSSHGTKQFRE